MNLKNKIAVSLSIVAVLIAGFVFVSKPKQIVVQNNVPVENQNRGSVTGPEVFSDFFSVNGVRNFYGRQPMSPATTTVCTIASPKNASSTITSFTADFIVSSSTASSVKLYRSSTTGSANGTVVGELNLAANAQGTVVASSTPVIFSTNVVPPNSYLLAVMSGGTGTFSPTGTCQTVLTAVR